MPAFAYLAYLTDSGMYIKPAVGQSNRKHVQGKFPGQMEALKMYLLSVLDKGCHYRHALGAIKYEVVPPPQSF